MPASLPGDATLDNPNQGTPVLFDPLSGTKNSPLDARRMTGYDIHNAPVYVPDPTNGSTGALCTGIGFGMNTVISGAPVNGMYAGGNFSDDYTPGKTRPDMTPATADVLVHIGGGRSLPDGTSNPYATGFGIGAAGNGAPRENLSSGRGTPAKLVTAAAPTAPGVAIEAGWVNRTGTTLPAYQSTFGSGSTSIDIPA